jgi:hypothetical protein
MPWYNKSFTSMRKVAYSRQGRTTGSKPVEIRLLSMSNDNSNLRENWTKPRSKPAMIISDLMSR